MAIAAGAMRPPRAPAQNRNLRSRRYTRISSGLRQAGTRTNGGTLMARERKLDSTTGNLAWLMPHPAFNPLNWWMLSAQRAAMLASMTNTRRAIEVWRAGADTYRALIRQQQDETLRILDGQQSLNAAPEEAAADAQTLDQSETQTAALLVQPMVEMTRAYGRVGRAFIVAQRDTMRALTESEKPH